MCGLSKCWILIFWCFRFSITLNLEFHTPHILMCLLSCYFIPYYILSLCSQGTVSRFRDGHPHDGRVDAKYQYQHVCCEWILWSWVTHGSTIQWSDWSAMLSSPRASRLSQCCFWDEVRGLCSILFILFLFNIL